MFRSQINRFRQALSALAVALALLSFNGTGHARQIVQEKPDRASPPTDSQTPPVGESGQVAAPPSGQESKETATDEDTASELTADELRSRITQVEGATDLTDAERGELLAAYRQALEHVNAASTWASKAAEFRKGRDEAPTRLEKTKAEFAAAQASPKPEIVENLALAELVRLLEEANRAVSEEQARTINLDEEAANREARRLLLPNLMAEANKRVETATGSLANLRQANLSSQMLAAKRAWHRSQRRAGAAEILAYEEELQSYTARRELLAARRELAQWQSTQAKARASALESMVARARQQDISQQQQLAAEELSRTVGPLRDLAERNQLFVDERAGLIPLLDQLGRKMKWLKRTGEDLDRDFRVLQDSIETEGMAEIVGPKLREKRTELLGLTSERLELHERKRDLAKARLRLAEIEDERLGLADIDQVVRQTVAAIPQESEAIRQQVEQRARELLIARREHLDTLKKDFDTYLDTLIRMTADQGSLLTKVEVFQEFVGRHVLWTKSASDLTRVRWPQRWYVPDRESWARLLGQLFDDLISQPLLTLLILLSIPAYITMRPRLTADMETWGRQASLASCGTFVPTARALAVTVLRAGLGPVILAWVGWRMTIGVDDRSVVDMARAWGTGMLATAFTMFLLLMPSLMALPNGLAESHFGWRDIELSVMRRNLWLLMLVGLPSTFVAVSTLAFPVTAWQDSFGRLALIVGMLALSYVTFSILHRRYGGLTAAWQKAHSGWIYNLRSIWFPLFVAFPLIVAVTSAVGYHFTAMELFRRLVLTASVLLAILLVHASMMRWLLVAQRRLALRRAEKVKTAKKEKGVSEETPQELRIELVSVGEQTRSLLRAAVVVTLALGVWSVWADALPALRFLEQVRLWSYAVTDPAAGEGAATTTQYITLDNLLVSILAVVAAVFLTKNIPGLLEITILQKLPLDRGGRFAITSISRYTIGVIGIVMAFSFLGVSWSNVQWLIAAMTVGLGFGLQEIFANFVSGLILLFERPIRVGDTVTVGGTSGDVTQIRIRATTITDWDRKELVIPNKEFVTGQVINWSLTDKTLRVIIPVGIAYGTDTDLAESILHRIATETEHVLVEPKPKVLFMGFGESALNFELRVFVPSVDYLLKVRHALNKAIDSEFRLAGIEIAFPQRDLHIRSIRDALPVHAETNGEAPMSLPGNAATEQETGRPRQLAESEVPGQGDKI
ncbi:MAG: mechanosensitive ion channel domain-containing protein [Planctomycetota bacterium]|jgi:potassium efflux system protein